MVRFQKLVNLSHCQLLRCLAPNVRNDYPFSKASPSVLGSILTLCNLDNPQNPAAYAILITVILLGQPQSKRFFLAKPD